MTHTSFRIFRGISVSAAVLTALFLSNTAHGQGLSTLKIPSAVRGVKASITDPLIRSVKLSWIANPKSDHVDEYAIYEHYRIGSVDPRVLLQTTTGTKVILSTWDDINYRTVEPPHTVNIDMDGFLQFWVIAHNKYGWGENRYLSTPYPGKYKQVSMTEAQQSQYEPQDVYVRWNCNAAIAKFYGDHCP